MSEFTLCIDTSAGTSVAVMQGELMVSEINFEENMMHAERIGEAINQALLAAKIKPQQISTVVVGRGPAPFTGLRIGIAAAAMFTEAVGAKIFGICSLDAIARAAFMANENSSTARNTDASDATLLVTADARRSENYWALYSGLSKAGAPLLVEGPGVQKPSALEEKFAGRQFVRADSMAVSGPKISAVELGRVFAAQVIDGSTSQDISALYLRAPDAVAPKVLRDFGKKVSG